MNFDTEFELSFGKSSSANYHTALELAEKINDFTPISTNSKLNVVKFSGEEFLKKCNIIEELYNIIKGWKSVKFIHKNFETQPYNFFNNFKQIHFCSKGYISSVQKESYCSTDNNTENWGCKLLTNIKRNLDSYSYYRSSTDYWYGYGTFESENVWRINKGILIERLKNEIDIKKIYHCPFFSIERVFNQIDSLPEIININEGDNWEIEYVEDFVGNIIQNKPIGIKYISKIQKAKINNPVLSISFPSLGEDEDCANENRKVNSGQRFIPEITFDEIGGIENIIDQIREVIELPLKRPDIYKHLGIKPHKGILLYGEPGNGKTLIAKAIANEVKAHFIPISGPELISKWHGQSEENLRNIFKEARELQPSIIFFDEIDSIAQKRSDNENARLDAKFVNQLLTLMDGMEAYDNVTILASTNRPELLDDALLRPGRFDYKIEIQKPDEIGCYKILKVATRNVPLDTSLDINKIVPKLVGCSGADIVFVVKEAAINALKRSVNVQDIITNNNTREIDLNMVNVTHFDFLMAIKKLQSNCIGTI